MPAACGFSKMEPHLTSRKSLAVLKEMFPDRLISLRGDIMWPADSRDLAPCDFFCWVT